MPTSVAIPRSSACDTQSMWTGAGVSVGTSMASTTDGSPHPSVKNRSRSGPLLTIVPPRRSMGWITPPTPSECRGETLFDHSGGCSHLVEYRAESKDECRGCLLYTSDAADD